MKPHLGISLSIVLFSALFFGYGCKKDSGINIGSGDGIKVKLQTNTNFGNYLVDKDGRTLYFFADDANGQNHCLGGGCELLWPVFSLDTLVAEDLGAGLNLSDFGYVTTGTGTRQITYLGWPLYRYAPPANGYNVPENPGQTQGDGIFGLWFVAKPDYSIMIAHEQLTGLDGKNYKSDYTEGAGKTIYFTDGRGLTLYNFTGDSSNNNNFTKMDFSNNNLWPIYETDQVIVPSILDKTQFGSINVFGRTQLTYKNWPLYHFGQDAGNRGSNKGISFPTPGIWHVPAKDIEQAP